MPVSLREDCSGFFLCGIELGPYHLLPALVGFLILFPGVLFVYNIGFIIYLWDVFTSQCAKGSSKSKCSPFPEYLNTKPLLLVAH